MCHSLDSCSGFNCSYLNQGVKKRNKSKPKQKTTTTTTKQAKKHIRVPRALARRNEVESERARLLWARPLLDPSTRPCGRGYDLVGSRTGFLVLLRALYTIHTLTTATETWHLSTICLRPSRPWKESTPVAVSCYAGISIA